MRSARKSAQSNGEHVSLNEFLNSSNRAGGGRPSNLEETRTLEARPELRCASEFLKSAKGPAAPKPNQELRQVSSPPEAPLCERVLIRIKVQVATLTVQIFIFPRLQCDPLQCDVGCRFEFFRIGWKLPLPCLELPICHLKCFANLTDGGAQSWFR